MATVFLKDCGCFPDTPLSQDAKVHSQFSSKQSFRAVPNLTADAGARHVPCCQLICSCLGLASLPSPHFAKKQGAARLHRKDMTDEEQRIFSRCLSLGMLQSSVKLVYSCSSCLFICKVPSICRVFFPGFIMSILFLSFCMLQFR